LTMTTTANTPVGSSRIIVTAQAGASSYSTIVFLVVGATSPATMISPPDGTILSDNSAAFAWDPGRACRNTNLHSDLPRQQRIFIRDLVRVRK
jgi:hypothetical protein